MKDTEMRRCRQPFIRIPGNVGGKGAVVSPRALVRERVRRGRGQDGLYCSIEEAFPALYSPKRGLPRLLSLALTHSRPLGTQASGTEDARSQKLDGVGFSSGHTGLGGTRLGSNLRTIQLFDVSGGGGGGVAATRIAASSCK